jgi:hypothetical protein
MPWSLVHPLPFSAVTFFSYTVRHLRMFHPGRFWGGTFVTISSMFCPSQLPGLWQVDPKEENGIMSPDRIPPTLWSVRHWPLLILTLNRVRQTRQNTTYAWANWPCVLTNNPENYEYQLNPAEHHWSMGRRSFVTRHDATFLRALFDVMSHTVLLSPRWGREQLSSFGVDSLIV